MNRNIRGFTLIESIVSMTIFAFLVSSIIGIYVGALRIDRKTRAQRVVTQNARYIMDYIAKEVRNGRIDYASYPGQTVSGVTSLYVINQALEQELFQLSGTSCTSASSNCAITLTKNSATTNLNSSNVRVTKLEFRTRPTTDPHTPAKTVNVQPNVIVILELQSNASGLNPQDQVTLNIQSTFTERYYPPR